MRKIIFGLICGAMATLSYADNCENARNTYDDIYCTNKIFASADADLNKNYHQLRKQLSDTQQKILKKSQLAWIRHRDAECSDDSKSTVYVQCQLNATQERNNWLQERIRECQTVGCKTTRLSE